MSTTPQRTTAPATGAAPHLQTPALYRCRVRHVRTEGVRHEFGYGMYLWLVDLDALPRLPPWLRPLARFRTRDHLGDPARSIRANVDAFLAARGIDLRGGKVLMLAQARSLGYVFNPLSVHWCYDASGELACILAEVHNTYGQRHCYLLRPDEKGRAEADKEFYVSPFFPVDGRYRMRFSDPGERVSVAMELRRASPAAGAADGTPDTVGGERAVFAATLDGQRSPATAGELLRCVVRYPPGGLRVPALIRYQGVKLFLRRLPIAPRPDRPPQEDVQ